jgi:hypothetical protein
VKHDTVPPPLSAQVSAPAMALLQVQSCAHAVNCGEHASLAHVQQEPNAASGASYVKMFMEHVTSSANVASGSSELAAPEELPPLLLPEPDPPPPLDPSNPALAVAVERDLPPHPRRQAAISSAAHPRFRIGRA